MNQKSLKAYLVSHIKPLDFYEDFFGAGLIKWKPGWTNLFCPFHNPHWKEQKGKSPSFGVHIESGAFRCASAACGLHGQHVVNFYDQFHAYNFERTLRQLYHRWVQPVVSRKLVEQWHETLMDSPSVLRYITDKRGVGKKLIKRFQLGFDGDRITMPIYDRFGLIVDVRRYDFTGQFKSKIISYKKGEQGYGTARFFPIDNLMASKGRLILCEGEWDTMLAIERGYTAVTVTSGAGNLPKAGGPNDVLELFRGRPVRIIYDVNDVRSDGSASDAGQRGAQRVAEVLAPLAKSIKIVVLPIKKSGGDITDWFMHYGKSKGELDKLIDDTKEYSRTDQQPVTMAKEAPEATLVRLDQAADAQYYYQPIEMECLVSGKDLSPYLAPKKIKAVITDPKTGDKSEETYTIDTAQNKHMLQLINCATSKQQSALKDLVDLPTGENVKLETLETFNMEELRLIPSINLRDMEGTYTIRRAVYVGHGLESNRTYRMRGYTLPDPNSQSCVHVITKADPVQDTIENFKLTGDIRKRLADRFTVQDNVNEHIRSIAHWLSAKTGIRDRADLHIAIDLAFHSPMTFQFNGEEITKGWIELLVIGDTRCGKGKVAEGLSQYYRLGETVTGENCSFAGLIGGLQKTDEHWFVTWGKIPLNDKRLVIVDEASAIHQEEMGRFSRVRSEGIAEIIKIVTERTRARTRLIWLSNPRSGRPLNTYNHGVESVSELFGNTEDVARLDLAMTVATSEVSSRLINSPPAKHKDQDRFEASDFTNLILWAWSRKSEQIDFTPRSTQMILRQAVVMGRKYSPTIPLIQSENVRIKIAKLAAAVAARCFSTDETGERLIIKSHHVQFACDFMDELYSKPSMGYDVYSSTAITQGTLPDEHTIENVIRGLKRYAGDFVTGLMEHRSVSYDDIANFTGMDRFEAQSLVGKLVRMRCLSKEGNLYAKRPSFSALLQLMKKKMKEEEHA